MSCESRSVSSPAERSAGCERRRGLRLGERELDLGLHQRERRAQLVARVGDERALAFEGGFEPGEHLVQPAAEPCDLVVCPGDGRRRPGLAAEIVAARSPIRSTGRRAAAASR